MSQEDEYVAFLKSDIRQLVAAHREHYGGDPTHTELLFICLDHFREITKKDSRAESYTLICAMLGAIQEEPSLLNTAISDLESGHILTKNGLDPGDIVNSAPMMTIRIWRQIAKEIVNI